ncbi:MAG: acyltransferase [Solobacterium sp.]|nr:acyltransferase [Solobacterium sp.]
MGKFRDIDILQYIYLNYLSKNVVHEGKGKVVPFRGAHVELGENSKLIIHDDSIEIGLNKVKGSKTETLIRLRKGAIWNVKGYCGLSYGDTLEVNENAELNSNYFTMNSNSTIVVNKKISIGNDVMIGRNVIIYDSDFHALNDRSVSEEVVIGDHVWIATNAMVLKGVHIGNGSVIAAGTIVKENVPEYVVIGSETKQKILSENANWKR